MSKTVLKSMKYFLHLRMSTKAIIAFSFVVFCFFSVRSTFSQAPSGINYQAALRNQNGALLINQSVSIKLALRQGQASGAVFYEELHATSTSEFGLVNLVFGEGQILSGDFSAVDWSLGPYFLEVAVDDQGGSNYTPIGTQQLMSVPYAFFAKTAESSLYDAVEDSDADSTNELQEWSTLPGIPNMLATMQSGEQYIGASQGLELAIVPVVFPTPFNNLPRVLCTPNTEAGTIYDDSFNVTIREVTSTGFVMIVNRVDGSIWGQNMTVNWIAFEP